MGFGGFLKSVYKDLKNPRGKVRSLAAGLGFGGKGLGTTSSENDAGGDNSEENKYYKVGKGIAKAGSGALKMINDYRASRKKKAAESKQKKESEDTEQKKESEDTEQKKESEDTEQKKESEDTEQKKES
ncbi:MAG: hypothetical protein IJV04_07970, partial [Lachnospiraceae bacterium]|nr:hypothetical protein [Lachnospiraceae bacterium]